MVRYIQKNVLHVNINLYKNISSAIQSKKVHLIRNIYQLYGIKYNKINQTNHR